MILPFRSLTDIVRDMSSAVTASSGRLIDVSVGSVLRAIIDANAGIVLWIQWMILLTLQTTRAATSTGDDLDSWLNDFSFPRLPAIAAVGTVTFSRFSPIGSALVPAGTGVKTSDGAVAFSVATDISNPAWNVARNGYQVLSGISAIDLPIMAAISGIAGNVSAGSIALISSPVPGIDLVQNTAAVTGGAAPETDQQYRARFQNFFAARSRGTKDAVGYAITSAKPGIGYVIQENVDVSGASRMGNFVVIVDDGSGGITPALFAAISNAVDSVRPVGATFSIRPPRVIYVQITMSIEYSNSVSVSDIQRSIQNALSNYIDASKIGGSLSITRMTRMLYQDCPGLINISNVYLNGGRDDLLAPADAALKFGTMAIS